MCMPPRANGRHNNSQARDLLYRTYLANIAPLNLLTNLLTLTGRRARVRRVAARRRIRSCARAAVTASSGHGRRDSIIAIGTSSSVSGSGRWRRDTSWDGSRRRAR